MFTLKKMLWWLIMLLAGLVMVGCSGEAVNKPVAPKESLPVKATLPANSVTWGPSYYADDLNVEAERYRAELESMKLIDQKALTGKRWGPSYAADEAIFGPHPVPNVAGGVTWGPSYYADDINLEPERYRDELEFMKRIELKTLKGLTEGPSYDQ